MKDILQLNSELTKLTLYKKKLNNKYHTTVNLFNDFTRFFDIAAQRNISEKQIEQYLVSANDEIALLYCSSFLLSTAKNNPLYQKYFPVMLNKLMNNVDYLYICLFKYNYWNLVHPVLYRHSSTRSKDNLKPENHFSLIKPYLEKIFEQHGYELYKRCKRGYNMMFTFFILFQEYFTSEMIHTFIQSMYKKINKDRYHKQNIIDYLSSSYVRISINNNQWKALQLLIKL